MKIIIKKYWRIAAGVLCLAIIFIVILTTIYSIAPKDFPVGQIFSIPKDSGVSKIADELKKEGIIKSAFLFKVYVVLIHDGRGVQAGDYLLKKPESALRIAYRTAYGVQDLPQIKITIPEGIAVSDISRLLVKNIPDFDSKTFITLAKPNEGYLFPDTYYFYQNTKPQDIVDMMHANFDKHTSTLGISAVLFGKSLKDIVTMASIVEKEATSTVNRKIIAGILWKRIDAGMRLQVDPPFFYFLGKTSAQLTLTDLKNDSPYNLYMHKGLPPTPINNPGTDAIQATLNPTDTKFWFYLSDSKGNMHYAIDHSGHLANKEKYLQ
jgi:UPF0755 protein